MEAAAMYEWSDRPLLLGGRDERVGVSRSDLQRDQKEKKRG